MDYPHYFEVSKIYIGITDLGEVEYRIKASVNNITGIGKTLEEASEDLKRKLQHYVKYQFE